MDFPAIIRPAINWLRKGLALPLAALGLMGMVTSITDPPSIPSFKHAWASGYLEEFRDAERFITAYLDKNGRLPDRATLSGWSEKRQFTGYTVEHIYSPAWPDERPTGFQLYSADSECSEPGFTKSKTDRFVINDWLYYGGADCYASPSGKHTLTMTDWAYFWKSGALLGFAHHLGIASFVLGLSWLLWPGGLIDGRPPWLRRILALPALVIAVTLLAAGSNAFSLQTERVAKARLVQHYLQHAALMSAEYRKNHGAYPDQAELDRWVKQNRLPLYDLSFADDCQYQNFKAEKTDQFILRTSVDDRCYAYPSGKISFPTTMASWLTDWDENSLQIGPDWFRDFVLFAGGLAMAWLAWRLWPRQRQGAAKA